MNLTKAREKVRKISHKDYKCRIKLIAKREAFTKEFLTWFDQIANPVPIKQLINSNLDSERWYIGNDFNLVLESCPSFTSGLDELIIVPIIEIDLLPFFQDSLEVLATYKKWLRDEDEDSFGENLLIELESTMEKE